MEKLEFYFSQSSLRAFQNCPLAFKYRYIDGIKRKRKSDAIEFGNNFHIMAERYFLEIKTGKNIIKDKKLINLFSSLEEKFTINKLYDYYPEYEIRINKENFKLMAKYDLIIDKKNGEIEIWDWKTGNRNLKKEYYENDIQTILYMYVLINTAQLISKEKVDNYKIKIKYWNPRYKEEVLEFVCDEYFYKKAEKRLMGLLGEIKKNDFLRYKKQGNEKCMNCDFKSICKEEE